MIHIQLVVTFALLQTQQLTWRNLWYLLKSPLVVMVGFVVTTWELRWSHLIGTLEILGGVWHILTKPWLGRRACMVR
jgi:hypothetical protein